MAITYTMSGWDTGAGDFVYWTSVDTPDTTPAETTPALIGTLINVEIIDTDGGTGGSSAIILPLSRRWVGKSPLVIASILLPAGVYSATTALFGSNSTTSVITLDVTEADGTVLASVQKIGLPDVASAVPTFTLTLPTQVNFKIYGDFANTVSYIFNIQVA
ncbi:MAG: hypothetical protein PHR16_11720 [Methylovulum sp.]|nr:hypothetical protein [Methylovulum sp.]